MLYAERHRPRGVGLAGAVHRTWAVAEKNDWQFSNPRIDTGLGHKVKPLIALFRLTAVKRHVCRSTHQLWDDTGVALLLKGLNSIQ